jgi:hypothetical protein
MDLTQTKLSKSEWVSIEVPVSEEEKKILTLINNGYDNVNIKNNDHPSMMSLMKIDYTREIESYLYTKYFEPDINKMISKSIIKTQWDSIINTKATNKNKKPNSVDIARLNNMDKNIHKQKERIYEFTLLKFCSFIIEDISKKTKKNYPFYTYTLVQLQKSNITNSNQYVQKFVEFIIDTIRCMIPSICRDIFNDSYNIIEKNHYILKYEDNALYEHQKKLFQTFKSSFDKKLLVLYTSATGSGKTVSPIGLSIGNRIIYICAARHVGLALAKSSISMGKCVAFAFGCESVDDIRLHYNSAVEFTKNKKSGSIAKVDNSDGSKVQIMICDIGSYLLAMNYMLVFNDEKNMILYWDEPTISLDKNEHPLHEIISKNWHENKISKVVLSCATLPKEPEIRDTLDYFRTKFDGAEIIHISSHDCKKTISLLDSNGKCVLPHLLFENYDDLQRSIAHCFNNLSLLRYFDLRELVRFVTYVDVIIPEQYKIQNYFTTMTDITMNSIKIYYLTLFKHIQRDSWKGIYEHMITTLNTQYNTNGGTLLTTEDAHTLTDGPTIFIVEDVSKIGKFYIQTSKIPTTVFNGIMEKIGINNKIQHKMGQLMRSLDDTLGKESDKDNKVNNDRLNPDVKKIMDEIETCRLEIQMVAMDSVYVPNTLQHQRTWLPTDKKIVENAFVPIIEETVVREIMALDIDNQLQLLLLLGIGVFDITNKNVSYMEIMKRLSTEQKLFLIIASSDYIYGTNYQLCHGILGKDLNDMTQQKTIQALGRIGRGNIQQEYTVRFRNDSLLKKLFIPCEINIEADNMTKLLS